MGLQSKVRTTAILNRWVTIDYYWMDIVKSRLMLVVWTKRRTVTQTNFKQIRKDQQVKYENQSMGCQPKIGFLECHLKCLINPYDDIGTFSLINFHLFEY